jgi:hypothetical protein
VSALADARRAVSTLKAHNEPLDAWLLSEVKIRGVRENAAVLAALEVPEYRERAATSYRDSHPDRARQLDEFLRYL